MRTSRGWLWLEAVGIAALVGCGGEEKHPVMVDYRAFTTSVADISATRGALRGQVVAPAGQGLPGVTVRISNARRQAGPDSFSTTTGPGGGYAIGNVEPATYRLEFSKSGFAPASRDVRVVAGEVTDVFPVMLAVAGPVNHTGTVELDASVYTGVEAVATVTVTDADLNIHPNQAETVTVKVASAITDPTGETLSLTETGPNTGVFTGTFGFERPFNSLQATPPLPGNGKVGVYAEATRTSETVTVKYIDTATAYNVSAEVTATATYQEPPSTLSGVVRDRVTGQPVAGAGVLLYTVQGQFVDEAVSRSDGSYAFYKVASGNYNLVIGREGFARETISGVVIP